MGFVACLKIFSICARLGCRVPAYRPATDQVVLAVAGAHLRELPLNSQLLERGAWFVRQCQTAPTYRLYDLPGSVPRKPGLVRVPDHGVAIEVELWQMPIKEFGEFVEKLPAPHCIGTIVLETGEPVKSFLCESTALQGANDISDHGGWRKFLSPPT
jgi:allophanate hydrolase